MLRDFGMQWVLLENLSPLLCRWSTKAFNAKGWEIWCLVTATVSWSIWLERNLWFCKILCNYVAIRYKPLIECKEKSKFHLQLLLNQQVPIYTWLRLWLVCNIVLKPDSVSPLGFLSQCFRLKTVKLHDSTILEFLPY